MSASSVASNPNVAAAIVVKGYDQVTKNPINFFAGQTNASIINSLKAVIPKAGERDKIIAPLFDTNDVGDYLKKLKTFGKAKPGFDIAIKYLKPSVTDPNYVRIRNSIPAAMKETADELVRDFTRAWDASDGVIISKLLESCKGVDAAEQIVLQMSNEEKSAAEILDKLLGDYDKSSAQRAITIRKELDDAKFEEKHTVKEFIGICEQKRAELERAGGAYSDNEMIDLVLTKGQANEKYKLFFLTYDANSSVNATVIHWPTFRAWAIKLDNRVKATNIESPVAAAATAEQEPVGQKRSWIDRNESGPRGRGRGHFRGGRGRSYDNNESFRGRCYGCGSVDHIVAFCPDAASAAGVNNRRSGAIARDNSQYQQNNANNMSSIYGQGRQNEGYYTHHSSGRWQRGRGRGRQVTYSDRQPGIIYQDNQQQQSRLYHSGRYTEDDANHAAAENYFARYSDSANMMTAEAFSMTEDKDALIDSGATDIYVKPKTRVKSFRPDRRTLGTATSGSSLQIMGEGLLGKVPVSVVDQRLKKQLIAVAKLVDLDYTVTFDRRGCVLSKPGFSKIIPRVGNLYPTNFSDIPEFSESSESY